MNPVALILLFAAGKLRLSADRADKVYLKGESVQFTCNAEKELSLSGFLLYCGGRNSEMKPQADSPITTSVMFTFTGTQIGTHGYLCFYGNGGHGTYKPQSDTVTITVVDRPGKPHLSPNRIDKVYTSVEKVIFLCSTVGSLDSNHSFALYRFGQHLLTKSIDISRKDGVIFDITLALNGPADYYCIHTRAVHERNVSSEKSEIVQINVLEKYVPPWVPALAVLAVIPVNVLVCIYCCKKGKFRSRGGTRPTPSPQDQTCDNPVPNVTSLGKTRETLGPEDRTDDNVLYADLQMKPRPKSSKEQQELHVDDGTVYAAVKL